MIKLRGFRIEPGEIETALTQQAGIAEAAVVARDHPSGERRLVAYVVCSPQTAGTPSDGELVADQCRQHLAGRLPQYMIPTSYCLLDALPLTANGKLDVRRLPPPQWQAEDAEQLVDPGTETERLMAGIWAEVLGVERVGVTQNFFAIGGDSIRSIQIVTRCKRAGLSLRPSDLFQRPTIATLAALVDRNRQHAEGGGEPASVVLAPCVSDEQLELALGQVEFEGE